MSFHSSNLISPSPPQFMGRAQFWVPPPALLGGSLSHQPSNGLGPGERGCPHQVYRASQVLSSYFMTICKMWQLLAMLSLSLQEPPDNTWHWPKILWTRVQGKGCQPLSPSNRFSRYYRFELQTWLIHICIIKYKHCRCDSGFRELPTRSNGIDWNPRRDNTNHRSDHSSADRWQRHVRHCGEHAKRRPGTKTCKIKSIAGKS